MGAGVGRRGLTTFDQWLRDGRAIWLPDQMSAEFDAYLDTLPWVVTTLDWAKMPPSEEFNVVENGRYELVSWIAKTKIGAHSHMVVWYSRDEGGLVVPLSFALANLDAMYLHYPGVRFAFGADVVQGQVIPAYADILQYGSGDKLVAVV